MRNDYNQLRLFPMTGTGGLYFAGTGVDGGYWGNSENTASGWTARHTSAALFGMSSGNNQLLGLYGNTGTTAGSVYSPTERFRFTMGGRLGIGTATPSTMLAVVGNASFTGNVTAPNLCLSNTTGCNVNPTLTNITASNYFNSTGSAGITGTYYYSNRTGGNCTQVFSQGLLMSATNCA